MDIKISAVKPIQNKIIQPFQNNIMQPAKIFQPEEKDDEAVTRNLNKITAKLKAGKRLTAEEKSFLLKHSPALYQTAKRVELQRNALKEQLKHAKSKEEVNEVIGHALGLVSKKDPDFEYVVAGLKDEIKTFKATDQYKKLPATRKEARKNGTYYPSININKDDKKEENTTGFYDSNGRYI